MGYEGTGPTTDVLTAQAAGTLSKYAAAGTSSGSMVLIQTQTASNSASINFTTGFIYNKYLLVGRNIVAANNNNFVSMKESTDGGSTYLATGYKSNTWGFNYSGVSGNNTATTSILICGLLGNAAGAQASFDIFLAFPSGSPSNGWGSGVFSDSSDSQNNNPAPSLMAYIGNTSVNSFQVLMNSGNIVSGVLSLYGFVE